MATYSLRGELKGHKNWVTSIVAHEDTLLSGSRDKTVIVWKLHAASGTESAGTAVRALRGHNHFVSDIAISSNGAFAVSSSWDKTARLWNIETGETVSLIQGHTKDVLSCAFSTNMSTIITGSRDKTIRSWDLEGKPIHSVEAHSDWVSCVRPVPGDGKNVISTGYDALVKLTTLDAKSTTISLARHTNYLSTVTVAPDGSLCASGGKDGVAILWDVSEGAQKTALYDFKITGVINSLSFSPTQYWLCAATTNGLYIWELQEKQEVLHIPNPNFDTKKKKALDIFPTSLTWSSDGATLYAGYTDNIIRVYDVTYTK